MLVVKRTGIGNMMRSLEVSTEDKLTALAQSLLHVKAEAFQELILVIQHREIIFPNELFFTPQGIRNTILDGWIDGSTRFSDHAPVIMDYDIEIGF